MKKKDSETKRIADQLSKLLGMDVEVVDIDNLDADASPEARKSAEEELAKRAAQRGQVFKVAEDILKLMGSNCCKNVDHRRVPLNGDDVFAINNAMATVVTHLGQTTMEYVNLLRGIIDDQLRAMKKTSHPLMDAQLKGFDLEMAAVQTILAIHFDVVTRPGKIDFTNHYAKMTAMIKAWSEGKETGNNEARTTH